MKIKLNEKSLVEIKSQYKKGNKLYCGQIKCDYVGSLVDCVDCNINHIQENSSEGTFASVKYEAIKHLLVD
ncbi:hypothetical protein [Paraclostridium bifermentans]|uniref:hypothetical protein n=1 Tax=Paraclostridium bifermentans TaxID=1490 RepID=UPI00115BBEB6|nr:hypothetical protein [Paraclostridium bifermentans]TQO59362.1 hypothetical protein D5S05_02515 [Paraclostridium bifermentans]